MVSNLFGYEDTLCGVCRASEQPSPSASTPHIRARAGISPSLPMSCGAAIEKARQLFLAVAAAEGIEETGTETTSWSEFETLAQYAQTEARIKPGMTDLRGI